MTSSLKSRAKAAIGPGRAHQVRVALEPAERCLHSVLTAEGRRSRATLARYKDRYRGERAVIIGNGPSLKQTDLSLLREEYTFGLNRAYLMFDELGFATSFLVAVNELLLSQVGDEVAAVPAPKFIGWSSRSHLPTGNDVTFVHSRRDPGFSTDVRHGWWEGATVTYAAMQLAFHMGFTRVILVGVDHSFVTKGPAHQTVESQGTDLNHFDAGYFGKGFRWQLPDLETSELAYGLARRGFEEAGRSVVDATVGGQLQVFPKVELGAELS